MRQILVSTLVFTTVGCVSTGYRFENTSPDRLAAAPIGARPIDASVRVAPTGSALDHDVHRALRETRTFEQVVPSDGSRQGLVLEVHSTHKDTSMGGAVASGIGRGLVNGLASGLTLGLVSGVSDWSYDYWVELEATLSCDGVPLGRYRARGSFEAELPNSSPLALKQERTRAAVTQSYAHAFGVLSAKLKADRSRIETSRCSAPSRRVATRPTHARSRDAQRIEGGSSAPSTPISKPGPTPVQHAFAEPSYGDARADAVSPPPADAVRETAGTDRWVPVVPEAPTPEVEQSAEGSSDRGGVSVALAYHIDRVKSGYSDSRGRGAEGYFTFSLVERSRFRLALGPTLGLSEYGSALEGISARTDLDKRFVGARLALLGKNGRARYGVVVIGQAARWSSNGLGSSDVVEARALATVQLPLGDQAFMFFSGGFNFSPTLYEFDRGSPVDPVRTRTAEISVGFGFE